MGQRRRPVRTEIVEELAQGRGGAVFARPHQPPGVVIGHDQQKPVAFAVGDLIDADPAHPANRSPASARAATTRATTSDTLRQATRNNTATTDSVA
jgi:hypothetical protein